ncbi:MAG TPA: nucleotidyltransferase domain-containing protein [Patescibacteria group bacterium]|nr:nucleotidyltransferase domain-containing protein [Patescibacteria group bacterium]
MLTPELSKELFPDNTIIEAYRGSIAHGMYIPNTDPNSIDDIDLMGVYMAPKEYYIGLGLERKHERAIECFKDKYDVVSYEFRKFVNLLLKSNPNVLGMLWLKSEHYLNKAPAGQLLIDNKKLFISKEAYNSFVGYAYGQLKHMESNIKLGYMGSKRKELVNKYGFDPKNASHCIRLLRMGDEYLNSGELNIHREDFEELLEIKTGKWSLIQVKAEAERLFKKIECSFKHSKLPVKPDYIKVEKLVMSVLQAHLN